MFDVRFHLHLEAARTVAGEFLVSWGFLNFTILLCRAHADLTSVSSLFTETLASRFSTSPSQGVERDASKATKSVF